ncbi:MAG TPA: hypothetical protein ENJ55_00240 [Rhizobiales bacterium]|nr:hypothetical protein [Hyphomicrobiales bacterium]
MRTGILIATMAMLTLNAGNLAAGQVLTGKWSGRSATSLEFLDGHKVKYCYKTKCTEQTYTGDKAKVIKFNWGKSQFTFTKTEQGYDGDYLRVVSSKVTLK